MSGFLEAHLIAQKEKEFEKKKRREQEWLVAENEVMD